MVEKGHANSRVGEGGDDVAPLLVALHDFYLVDELHRQGGGDEGDGEGKGDFHFSVLRMATIIRRIRNLVCGREHGYRIVLLYT